MSDPIQEWDEALRRGGAKGALARIRADLVAADDAAFENMLDALKLWMGQLTLQGVAVDILVEMRGEMRRVLDTAGGRDTTVTISSPELTTLRAEADRLRVEVAATQARIRDEAAIRREWEFLLREEVRLNAQLAALAGALAATSEHQEERNP